MCFIECPECRCTINELDESRGVKIYLIEESYFHSVELRGVDAGHEFLEIFGSTFEMKVVERGEDRAL